jgi:hypothetical protein
MLTEAGKTEVPQTDPGRAPLVLNSIKQAFAQLQPRLKRGRSGPQPYVLNEPGLTLRHARVHQQAQHRIEKVGEPGCAFPLSSAVSCEAGAEFGRNTLLGLTMGRGVLLRRAPHCDAEHERRGGVFYYPAAKTAPATEVGCAWRRGQGGPRYQLCQRTGRTG